MKSKYLFFAMTTAAFAACTNEDFVQDSTVVGNDNLGKLIQSPVLGLNVQDDSNSRVYEERSWVWKPTMSNDQSPVVLDVDKIGLCWTGVNNNEDGYPGPAKETGDYVYTNVKFNHIGWLYEGETEPKLHCGVLENGALIDGVPQALYSNGVWSGSDGGLLDMGTGMFKTDNSTIYEGEYIVYFPYNDSFWNSPVTAKQERIMTLDATSDQYSLVSKHAFNIGYVNNIKGGDEACKFRTSLLTTGIKFILTGDLSGISDIVLLSRGQKAFITSQTISAKKLKNEWNAGKGLSTDIYMDSEDNTSSSTLVVKGVGAASTLSNGTLYVPFLPNQIENLEILFIKNDGTVATLSHWGTGLDFTAKSFKQLSLAIDGSGVTYTKNNVPYTSSFTAVNYAYDEDSFVDAYKKAENNTSIDGRTIILLDDITLTDNVAEYGYNNGTNNQVIIKSHPDNAADVKNTLTLAHHNKAAVKYDFYNTVFDVNVTTVPQGCCNNGLVSLKLSTCSTEEYTNLTVYGAELELHNNVNFAGDVNSLYEPEDEEGVLHEDRVPSINVNKTKGTIVTFGSKVRNQGQLNVGIKNKVVLDGVAEFVNENTDFGKASINVSGNGNIAEDGTILMEGRSTLENNGDIYNKGNIDNNSTAGSFKNNANATFTDFVGSTLSGHRIVNNDNAEFISEVNSIVRYNNAINPNGIRPTTIVRFVDKGTTGDFTTTYQLKPNTSDGDGIYVPYSNGKLVKFESELTPAAVEDCTLTISGVKQENTDDVIPVKVGDFKVVSGKILFKHAELTIDGNYIADGAANTGIEENLTVTGDFDINNVVALSNISNGDVYLKVNKVLNIGGNMNLEKVAGTVMFETSTKLNIGTNMNVNAGVNVAFYNKNITKIGQPGVNGVLTNNGSIDIKNAISGSDVAAIVWCNKRAGSGTYANNSYPQYY